MRARAGTLAGTLGGACGPGQQSISTGRNYELKLKVWDILQAKIIANNKNCYMVNLRSKEKVCYYLSHVVGSEKKRLMAHN